MRTALMAATAACLLASSPAAARAGGDDCAKLDDDAARLKCYDKVFRPKRTPVPKKTGAAGEANKPTGKSKGKWVVEVSKSPVDDSEQVIMFVFSDEPKNTVRKEKTSLGIRCKSDTTSLLYQINEYMSDIDGGDRVLYRIDKNKAVTRRFAISNSKTTLGLWSGSTSIPFIKTMFGARRIFIMAVPYSQSAVNQTFDITGLEEAIKPLRKACHW